MDERTQVLLSTVVGAAVGGILGWLHLTARGRRMRVQIEPFFDNVINEINQTQHAMDKACLAASEGRRVFGDVFRQSGDGASWQSGSVGQTSEAGSSDRAP